MQEVELKRRRNIPRILVAIDLREVALKDPPGFGLVGGVANPWLAISIPPLFPLMVLLVDFELAKKPKNGMIIAG